MRSIILLIVILICNSIIALLHKLTFLIFMKRLTLSLVFAGLSSAALAHTPYVKPLNFEPVRGGQITLDASFAEQFFVPEVAISNAKFEVVTPNGTAQSVDQVVNLSTRNVLEHKLEQEGTYLISTGKRLGAIFRVYEKDGERGSVRGNDEPLPEGAVLTDHFQSLTYATTYVTNKAPNDTALQPKNQGLEFFPKVHPNGLFNGDTFTFDVLFNGQPVAQQDIKVFLAEDQFSEESDGLTVTTNSQGEASITLDEQGVYLLQVRKKGPAPADADVPQYSYTTTLTLEAY